VVLRVAVEEHAELEERVGTVFDAGDHAARGEGGLLDVAVEVLRVLVQDEFAEFVELFTSQPRFVISLLRKGNLREIVPWARLW